MTILVFLPVNLPAHNSYLQTGRKIAGRNIKPKQQSGVCHSVIADISFVFFP